MPTQPTQAKRNSGRNGRRRGTAQQAWLSGNLRDHQRRYGRVLGQGGEMPPAPEWFTPAMRAIWHALLEHAAPLRLLHPVDHGVLVGLTVAMDRHRCLAAEVAA